jgi:hypothetical protein
MSKRGEFPVVAAVPYANAFPMQLPVLSQRGKLKNNIVYCFHLMTKAQQGGRYLLHRRGAL